MDEKFKQVEDTLKKYNQTHLLKAYERLTSEEEKQNFLNSILTIDFSQLDMLFKNSKEKPIFEESKIEPIDYVEKSKLSNDDYNEYNKIGTSLIRNGKLAVVTMAGGQGTRLGHDGPKGTFDIGLSSHKSIFALLCDTMKKAREDFHVDIPWYIMTSDENDAETKVFFENNNFFGYPESCIIFFKQGKLPMLDVDGKVLIDENGQIKEASDGHGGVFQSLLKDGILYSMKTRGIEWVFVGGVDNILVKPVDPVFIGLAVKKNALAGGKSIVKANPYEKVGVFCKRDGKPSVIEYSEISPRMAEEQDKDGNLKYGESHILCNLFHINAVEKISQKDLPYHIAFKKAKCLDDDGNLIVPDKPNAYKFEAFLFDAFESLDDIAVMRVKREEEFAPIKNAEGVDSPETAKELYLNYHKNFEE